MALVVDSLVKLLQRCAFPFVILFDRCRKAADTEHIIPQPCLIYTGPHIKLKGI